jgi:hypothetical protein
MPTSAWRGAAEKNWSLTLSWRPSLPFGGGLLSEVAMLFLPTYCPGLQRASRRRLLSTVRTIHTKPDVRLVAAHTFGKIPSDLLIVKGAIDSR